MTPHRLATPPRELPPEPAAAALPPDYAASGEIAEVIRRRSRG